ncbi:hypothetical protein HanRHA438_Chr08g0369011 [Helianthus annuus]|nr:hypothetical protein HanIR_Chr08g0385131 [Helianthus annuus]KAJ0899475.1 hypothetical protein HanRHA438_Chr08g0369011 [Helianthus annuus]
MHESDFDDGLISGHEFLAVTTFEALLIPVTLMCTVLHLLEIPNHTEFSHSCNQIAFLFTTFRHMKTEFYRCSSHTNNERKGGNLTHENIPLWNLFCFPAVCESTGVNFRHLGAGILLPIQPLNPVCLPVFISKQRTRQNQASISGSQLPNIHFRS